MCTRCYAEKTALSPIITKGTAASVCGYAQERYVTFGGNVRQYPSDRYGSGVRSEQARRYGGVPDDMGFHGRSIIKTANQLPYRNSGPEARMERLLVQAAVRDPGIVVLRMGHISLQGRLP